MKKSRPIHKILALVLSFSVVLGSFIVFNTATNAASYYAVSLNVPRVSQCPGRGDCAIASIASVEAYFNNRPSGDYTSYAYQTVYSANGYSCSANWSALGYTKYDSFSMATVYSQLSAGYPVIVHRSSNHYSVVYGYKGSTSSLELSGFLLFDVDDSYSNSSSKMDLATWKRSYTLDKMVLRNGGAVVPTTPLTITSNHPSSKHIKGDTYTIYGMVTSRYSITSVKMSITDNSGNVAKDSVYSATPNVKSFSLANGDSKMNFSKLDVGAYKYVVTAKDSSGDSETYSYSFNVVNDIYDYVTEEINDDIKYTSYSAIVTADPSLNLRGGAGTSYAILASIPYNTKVSISAESGDWAKVTYAGKTGWVSMQYLKEYIASDYYVRSTTEAAIKNSASSSGSTVVKIAQNAIAKAVGESNGWLKVEYNKKTGWLSSSACIKGVGDANGNGSVDSADALAMLQNALGLKKMSTAQMSISDLNGDTKVNSVDALIVLQLVTA